MVRTELFLECKPGQSSSRIALSRTLQYDGLPILRLRYCIKIARAFATNTELEVGIRQQPLPSWGKYLAFIFNR